MATEPREFIPVRIAVLTVSDTRTLADEKINVMASNTITDKKKQLARIAVTIEIRDLHQLNRVMDKISQLRNITEVMRGSHSV